MADPAKKESISLEDLIRFRLPHTDCLAKTLAKVLIDKGVITTTDLLKEVLKEQGANQIVDSRGKKWVR
jgi:hypothetical protein